LDLPIFDGANQVQKETSGGRRIGPKELIDQQETHGSTMHFAAR
jgi:hypothetical protein